VATGRSREPGDFNADQFQAKVAHLAQDAVKMGLVADLADQDGLFAAWFEGQPVEGRPETLGQAAPDRDPVPGRLHVPSGALRIWCHAAPDPGEWSVITHGRFHPGD
jgi:hypothetical protein